ncbi:arginase family protein [Nocardia iowensis]|uniref:Arginase family protein n=1 Tax=Nocardia iowensis TaxID=204891 RepID=A0ABX8RIQ5_NOCIO|nr:arginase family protein [Nocardia iowensis]QXN88857.1 arginase family protein [Nocardia iowensis]
MRTFRLASPSEQECEGHPLLTVIGAPFNSAGTTGGVAKAPAGLRAAGLLDALRAHRGDVRDIGDVDVGTPSPSRDPESGLLAQESLTATTTSVRSAVAASIEAGEFPLVLGGDCPVLLGALRGAQDVLDDVALVFVDGHEDAWPPKRSTTGEAADCELGLALAGTDARLPPELADQLPALDPTRVVALGPRDAAELQADGVPSLASTIALLTDRDLHEKAAVPTEIAVGRFRRRGSAWWLHVDLDVLSTAAMPAVDYPQPGGLDWSDLTAITDAAIQPGCVGMTLTIYNPDLDSDRRHAHRIVDYLAESLSGTPESADR